MPVAECHLYLHFCPQQNFAVASDQWLYLRRSLRTTSWDTGDCWKCPSSCPGGIWNRSIRQRSRPIRAKSGTNVAQAAYTNKASSYFWSACHDPRPTNLLSEAGRFGNIGGMHASIRTVPHLVLGDGSSKVQRRTSGRHDTSTRSYQTSAIPEGAAPSRILSYRQHFAKSSVDPPSFVHKSAISQHTCPMSWLWMASGALYHFRYSIHIYSWAPLYSTGNSQPKNRSSSSYVYSPI